MSKSMDRGEGDKAVGRLLKKNSSRLLRFKGPAGMCVCGGRFCLLHIKGPAGMCGGGHCLLLQ